MTGGRSRKSDNIFDNRYSRVTRSEKFAPDCSNSAIFQALGPAGEGEFLLLWESAVEHSFRTRAVSSRLFK